MSAIRLVVSDVDGTLVDKQKQLTPGTIAAVEKLRSNGTGFTIISARPRSGIMPLADTLALDDPIGAFNGGTIFKRDGTVLERHVIDPAVARGAFEIVGDADVDIWVFADDVWYASTLDGGHVPSERVSASQEPVIRASFNELLDRADKITFVSDDAALLGGLTDKLAAAFGKQATVVQSQTYYLDITALAANKGAGITALAAAFDVPLAETAAIGDQLNDIAMLDIAGLAVAMGNAPDRVKAGVDAVTTANDADGVAHAIDTIILPRIASATPTKTGAKA